jgi:hypothetical protein
MEALLLHSPSINMENQFPKSSKDVAVVLLELALHNRLPVAMELASA